MTSSTSSLSSFKILHLASSILIFCNLFFILS
nr:MAG TPA: hypothetical protein [Caudoviricetes sp.]DAU73290.1 MAG TPA: hypothetical protein [Caudoviricetes sp.]